MKSPLYLKKRGKMRNESSGEIPDFLLYAWFALPGLYMEMPGKKAVAD